MMREKRECRRNRDYGTLGLTVETDATLWDVYELTFQLAETLSGEKEGGGL